MENYVKTKNIISNVCNQSGLSLVELSGVLNECLAEVRFVMLNNAVVETMQLKEQLKEADDGTKHD